MLPSDRGPSLMPLGRSWLPAVFAGCLISGYVLRNRSDISGFMLKLWGKLKELRSIKHARVGTLVLQPEHAEVSKVVSDGQLAELMKNDVSDQRAEIAVCNAQRAEFTDVDGVAIRGILLLPAQLPAPALVMAHGFSLTWRQGLMPYARACCKSGLAVLVFDHRSFGESDGEPRCCVDYWAQIRGYKRALDFLQTRHKEVDASKLAVWGFSLTSAIALMLGAVDERVSAVVAISPGPIDPLPAIDGARLEELREEYESRTACDATVAEPYATGRPRPVVCGFGPWPLDASGREKRARAWFGNMIPDPNDDANHFFRRQGGPKAAWQNMAYVSNETIPDWDAAVRHIAVPTLLIGVKDDCTTPMQSVDALLAAMPPQMRLKHVVGRGGHFGLFDTPISEQELSPAPNAEEMQRVEHVVTTFLRSSLHGMVSV